MFIVLICRQSRNNRLMEKVNFLYVAKDYQRKTKIHLFSQSIVTKLSGESNDLIKLLQSATCV